MANIDQNAQTEMQKLQDVLNALVIFQAAMDTAQGAMPTQGGAGLLLVSDVRTAAAPFNQRLKDMIAGINDASID